MSSGEACVLRLLCLYLCIRFVRMEGRGPRGAEPAVSVVESDLFYVLNSFVLPRFLPERIL